MHAIYSADTVEADCHRLAEMTVTCFRSFADADGAVPGRLLALSTDGCQLRTCEPLYRYSYVQLRVMADNMRVVDVHLAAVRWVHGLDYFLQFLTVRGDQQAPLHDLLECVGASE